jgi:hypothetical protein
MPLLIFSVAKPLSSTSLSGSSSSSSLSSSLSNALQNKRKRVSIFAIHHQRFVRVPRIRSTAREGGRHRRRVDLRLHLTQPSLLDDLVRAASRPSHKVLSRADRNLERFANRHSVGVPDPVLLLYQLDLCRRRASSCSQTNGFENHSQSSFKLTSTS